MDGLPAEVLASLNGMMGEVEMRGEGLILPPVECPNCHTNLVWSDAPPESQVLHCPRCVAA